MENVYHRELPFQGALYHNIHSSWVIITPSPLIASVTAGSSWQEAYFIQAFVTIAVVVLIAALFAVRGRRPFADIDRILIVGATFLASPYSFHYDMAGLAVCLLIANTSRPELNASLAWRIGVLLLWSTPNVMTSVAGVGYLTGHHWPPIGTLMIAAGLGLVLWAQRSDVQLFMTWRFIETVRPRPLPAR